MSETLLHVVCPHCDAVNRLPEVRLEAHGRCGSCRQPLFTARPLKLTAANFQTHIGRSDLPVVVDFWAPWCGPCRTMTPIFEEAASRLEPRVRLAKVDTEQEQGLAARYQIRSIPTLAIFRGGREIARQSGALDLPRLIQWVEQQTRG